MSNLGICLNHIFPSNVSLQLEDFHFFQPRLREKTEEWSPQRVKELWMTGYCDPLNYYTFVDSLFFGNLGLVGVKAGIVQAVGQFVG